MQLTQNIASMAGEQVLLIARVALAAENTVPLHGHTHTPFKPPGLPTIPAAWFHRILVLCALEGVRRLRDEDALWHVGNTLARGGLLLGQARPAQVH